jgi:hypothetical protein
MPLLPQSTFEPSLNRLDPVEAPRFSTVLGITVFAPTSGTTTYSKGQVMAEYAGSASAGIYGIYNSAGAASIGLNIPKGLLQYTVTVDSSGNVALAGEFGQTQRGCPMYMPGGAIWRIGDLIGLDGNAVTVMGGAIVEGSISQGGLVKL